MSGITVEHVKHPAKIEKNKWLEEVEGKLARIYERQQKYYKKNKETLGEIGDNEEGETFGAMKQDNPTENILEEGKRVYSKKFLALRNGFRKKKKGEQKRNIFGEIEFKRMDRALKRETIEENKSYFQGEAIFVKDYLNFLCCYTKHQLQFLEDIFIAADEDEDRLLSPTELSDWFEKEGYPVTKGELRGLLQMGDADKDGHLSYEEFVTLCIRLEGRNVPFAPVDGKKIHPDYHYCICGMYYNFNQGIKKNPKPSKQRIRACNETLQERKNVARKFSYIVFPGLQKFKFGITKQNDLQALEKQGRLMMTQAKRNYKKNAAALAAKQKEKLYDNIPVTPQFTPEVPKLLRDSVIKAIQDGIRQPFDIPTRIFELANAKPRSAPGLRGNIKSDLKANSEERTLKTERLSKSEKEILVKKLVRNYKNVKLDTQ